MAAESRVSCTIPILSAGCRHPTWFSVRSRTVIQNPFPLGVKAEVRLVKGTDLPAGRVFRRVEEHMFIPQGKKSGIPTFPARNRIGK